jgi:hypothetical protein
MQDDSIQLISDAERNKRICLYVDHNIGWVARPKLGKDGFIRGGRFKQASDMNYRLALTLMREKHFAALIEAGEDDRTNGTACPEDCALELAVEQMFEELNRKHRPWAGNSSQCVSERSYSSVDLDTIVSEGCLRHAARELAESPKVTIIQYKSDVMQVAHHYFKNSTSYSTLHVNKSISVVCTSGKSCTHSFE